MYFIFNFIVYVIYKRSNDNRHIYNAENQYQNSELVVWHNFKHLKAFVLHILSQKTLFYNIYKKFL